MLQNYKPFVLRAHRSDSGRRRGLPRLQILKFGRMSLGDNTVQMGLALIYSAFQRNNLHPNNVTELNASVWGFRHHAKRVAISGYLHVA